MKKEFLTTHNFVYISYGRCAVLCWCDCHYDGDTKWILLLEQTQMWMTYHVRHTKPQKATTKTKKNESKMIDWSCAEFGSKIQYIFEDCSISKLKDSFFCSTLQIHNDQLLEMVFHESVINIFTLFFCHPKYFACQLSDW